MAQAMAKPCGVEAMKNRMINQYIEEFGKIVQGSQLTVVPKELAQIRGFFEGLEKVVHSTKGDQKP
jgi:hypothetical protein